MPTFEGSQDDIESFDWDSFGEPEIDCIALNVLARSNEQANAANSAQDYHEWNEEEFNPPIIVTPGYGNEIAVQIRAKDKIRIANIRIGFYSPVNDGFVIFPELVEPEEAGAIKLAAEIERAKEINAFNSSSNDILPRFDYEIPGVRSLHREHHQYLGGTNIVRGVLEKQYESHDPDVNTQVYEMDRFTQAAICVRAKGILGKSGLEHFVGLRIAGSFISTGDVKRRQQVQFVNIAERNLEPGYENDFEPVSDLIEPYETEDLVEIAQKVVRLSRRLGSSDHPTMFDIQNLAIVAHPKK